MTNTTQNQTGSPLHDLSSDGALAFRHDPATTPDADQGQGTPHVQEWVTTAHYTSPDHPDGVVAGTCTWALVDTRALAGDPDPVLSVLARHPGGDELGQALVAVLKGTTPSPPEEYRRRSRVLLALREKILKGIGRRTGLGMGPDLYGHATATETQTLIDVAHARESETGLYEILGMPHDRAVVYRSVTAPSEHHGTGIGLVLAREAARFADKELLHDDALVLCLPRPDTTTGMTDDQQQAATDRLVSAATVLGMSPTPTAPGFMAGSTWDVLGRDLRWDVTPDLLATTMQSQDFPVFQDDPVILDPVTPTDVPDGTTTTQAGDLTTAHTGARARLGRYTGTITDVRHSRRPGTGRPDTVAVTLTGWTTDLIPDQGPWEELKLRLPANETVHLLPDTDNT